MQEHHCAQNRKQHQRHIFYLHLDMPQLFERGGDGSSVIFGIQIALYASTTKNSKHLLVDFYLNH
tara:strand:- start:688 stop:882 length:195 start_codon:yes stop_codon:yes gene_type:complete